ncbi:NAD(P)-dependent alcohol dehydrogenase [Nocardioides sp. NPDC004968]|uniref:NAD(P)-dependent alcohol dehydrogenase n=1 Tax=Nocardioides sp. NPDC004968 TaxID=3155894 RepID=UPI0033BA0874
MAKMKAAFIWKFGEPLRFDEVDIPTPKADELLIKVGACGMCRSDYQQMHGYFEVALPAELPIIPGHEIAGRVVGKGSLVPDGQLGEGDLVLVDPGWGDGTCEQCVKGNTQLCTGAGRWLGFGPPGGYAEYVAVPYQHAIKLNPAEGQGPEFFAPLTDAGATPYRGIKKLVERGKFTAGHTVVVTGIGGLGSYAVQYARLFSGGADIVAFSRTQDKLDLALKYGADHAINTRDATPEQVQDQLEELTGRRRVDAILDCAGGQDSLDLDFRILNSGSDVAQVGLMASDATLPVNLVVGSEQTWHGSFWSNHQDISEVVALATAGKIQNTITPVKFEDINENLERVARGDVVGRQVIVFD